MRSPAISLGWEIWNRSRWASALVLGAIPICAFLPFHETFAVFELLAMLFAIATIFWMHSYAETDQKGKHAGFPSRTFVLPLQTVALVAFPIVLGIAAIVLFYAGWSCLVFPRWGVALSWPWLQCHLLTLAAMMTSLQAIVWSFHRFPWIRFALLSTILISLGAFGILMPAHDFPKLGQTGTIICLLSILLLACAGAIIGVNRDRHGEWEGSTERLKFLDALPRRKEDFQSPAQAQVWFEWRRKGFFLAGLFAVASAAAVVILPVPSALYFEKAQTVLTYAALPIMVAIMASTLGLGVAKSDFWSRDPALHPFLATRPVSTGDLVMAKLKVAALIVLLGFILSCILAIPVFNVPRWLTGEDGNFPSWNRFKAENAALIDWARHPLTILTAFALTWKTMVQWVCVGLTGRPRTILWKSCLRVGVFCGLITVAITFAKDPARFSKWLPLLPWLAALILLLKVAATWWAMRVAVARRFYSPAQLLGLAFVWTAIAGCILGTAVWVGSSKSVPGEILLFAVAWLFPDGTLARCAINLASNRHR